MIHQCSTLVCVCIRNRW